MVLLGSNTIDNQLRNLHMICDSKESGGSGRKVYASWICQDVRYYVYSGRASCEFIRMFINLSREDLEQIVDICAKHNKMTLNNTARIFDREQRKRVKEY